MREFIKNHQSDWKKFDYIKDQTTRYYFLDILTTIQKLDIGEWFYGYEPEEKKGFMFSSHEYLDKIRGGIEFEGHSGASYGCSIRTVHTYYQKGEKEFKKEWLRRFGN